MAHTVAEGSTTISASLGALMSGSTGLTVTPVTLISLTITPVGPISLVRNTSLQLTAMGTYSNGTVQAVTASATWVSTDANKVSVNNTTQKGLATAGPQPNQTVTISATIGSVSNTVTVNTTL